MPANVVTVHFQGNGGEFADLSWAQQQTWDFLRNNRVDTPGWGASPDVYLDVPLRTPFALDNCPGSHRLRIFTDFESANSIFRLRVHFELATSTRWGSGRRGVRRESGSE
ncbi:hypothetical protein ABH922_005230 [Rhodococcus sp. 27YEA15]